jgi:hypothetical protein
LERLERDRDAIMDYSGAVPRSLHDLSPEGRHQVYKMLRLKVLAYPDKSLEVSGAILAGGGEEPREWPDGVLPGGRRPRRSVAQGGRTGCIRIIADA